MDKTKRENKLAKPSRKAIKKKKDALLIWNVPKDLKARYKIACILAGLTVRESILRHLEDTSKKLEAKGISKIAANAPESPIND